MTMIHTHTTIRAQQRGIPPLIDQLLEAYGQEQHDGHGVALHVNLDKMLGPEGETFTA
jgi:hypothetical protein